MESFFLSFPPPETKSDRRRCGSGGERTATMAEDCCRLENEARFHFESPAFRQQTKKFTSEKKKRPVEAFPITTQKRNSEGHNEAKQKTQETTGFIGEQKKNGNTEQFGVENKRTRLKRSIQIFEISRLWYISWKTNDERAASQ